MVMRKCMIFWSGRIFPRQAEVVQSADVIAALGG